MEKQNLMDLSPKKRESYTRCCTLGKAFYFIDGDKIYKRPYIVDPIARDRWILSSIKDKNNVMVDLGYIRNLDNKPFQELMDYSTDGSTKLRLINGAPSVTLDPSEETLTDDNTKAVSNFKLYRDTYGYSLINLILTVSEFQVLNVPYMQSLIENGIQNYYMGRNDYLSTAINTPNGVTYGIPVTKYMVIGHQEDLESNSMARAGENSIHAFLPMLEINRNGHISQQIELRNYDALDASDNEIRVALSYYEFKPEIEVEHYDDSNDTLRYVAEKDTQFLKKYGRL